MITHILRYQDMCFVYGRRALVVKRWFNRVEEDESATFKYHYWVQVTVGLVFGRTVVGTDLEVLWSSPYEVFVGVRVVIIKIEESEVSSFNLIQYKIKED